MISIEDKLKKFQEKQLADSESGIFTPEEETVDPTSFTEQPSTETILDNIVPSKPEEVAYSEDYPTEKAVTEEVKPSPKELTDVEKYKQLLQKYEEKLNAPKKEESWGDYLPDALAAAHNIINYGQGSQQKNLNLGYLDKKRQSESQQRKEDLSGLQNLQNMYQQYLQMTQKQQPQQMSELDRAKIESEKARAELFKANAQKSAMEKKEPKTEGEKVLDREFAKEYNKWETGGKVDFVENKKIFDEAIRDLSKDAKGKIKTPTGPWAGTKALVSTPLVDTDAEALQDRVRKAINGMLRATLGAQFTEKEGERIFEQTFKITRDPEENIKNMRTELAKIEGRAKLLEDQGKYFRKEKTLSGYEPSAKVLEKTSENKVLMQSPDGELARVPKESVDSYLKKGARIIEE